MTVELKIIEERKKYKSQSRTNSNANLDMSRNSEKHFAGLNRVYLTKQWDQQREGKRPHIDTLTTAVELRKWIPSIKDELDHTLNQLCGVRKHAYTPDKIKEFEQRVKFLRSEHKRFVNKVLKLDPHQVGIPWEAKGYVSKRKLQGGGNTSGGNTLGGNTSGGNGGNSSVGAGAKRKKIILNVLKKEKEVEKVDQTSAVDDSLDKVM